MAKITELDEGQVAEAAAQNFTRAEITDNAKKRLEELARSGKFTEFAETGEPDKKFRAFVAPNDKFYRVLVKAGENVQVRDPNSPTGMREVSRKGDVFLEFQDGIVVLDPDNTEDQERIAYCEKHVEKIRDIDDPMTAAWAYMKELQQETARSDKRLPASLNLEGLLRGDTSSSNVPHSTTDRARSQKERMEGN